MSPLALVVIGGLLALVGGLWSRPLEARADWRAGAALAVALTAVGVWWSQPGGTFGAPVDAPALQGEVPATTTVVLGGDGARRRVRQVALSRPVPGSQGLLWGMLLLGVVGVVGQLGRAGTDSRARMAAALPAAAGVVAAAVWATAGGSASGEPPIREYLAGVDGITGFTVPEGEWTYRPAGLAALAAAAFAGVLGALSLFAAPQQVAPLVPVGAALAVAGVLWQLTAAGGLVWRPAEACAWVAAAALTVAALDARHAGLLVGAAVACAGLGIS